MSCSQQKNKEASSSLNMDVELGPHQKTHTNNTSLMTADPAPRYLTVKGNFTTISPFVISKDVYSILGQVKNLKKVKDGLLIETVSAAQSRRLLNVKVLCGQDVEIEAHRTLNYAKGVISCRDLLNCTIDEILEELKSEGVIAVRRITTKINGTIQETPGHILTFNKPILPKKIKVAFYSLDVRPYIPPPMRCFRCQKFGHTAVRCNDEPRCVCGKATHEGASCEQPIKCVNCDGPHSARYKGCPRYKEEVAIQELKTKENLTYFEAKKKIAVATPVAGTSYASVAASKPNIDISELSATLFPILLPAIGDVIIGALGGTPNTKNRSTAFMTPSCNTGSVAGDVEVSVASDTNTEKRKRQGTLSSEEETSDQQGRPTVERKKRPPGRPKSKPRGPKT